MIFFLTIKFGDYRIRYTYIAFFGVGLVILFEVLMMVATVESPRWLFSKNKDDSGTQVLKILRGDKCPVAREVAEIRTGLQHKHSIKEQLCALRRQTVCHPFTLVVILMLFRHFSGINVAVYYASMIFSNAACSEEKVNLVSFGAVGCVQVLSSLVSVVLVDYLGRRVLLITSSVMMALSSLLIGAHFLIFNESCLDSLDRPNGTEFLAIVSVAMFVTGYSLGWGPIPLSSSELLSNQIRTLGGSISLFVGGLVGTIVLLTFPSYLALVGAKFAWWTFSIVMGLSIVYVVLFLPEAKGKSLEEIQEIFGTRKIIMYSCSRECSRCKHTRRSRVAIDYFESVL
jgi:MFS family permease